jgi:tetratricopeptide (TPR) repeat protein
MIMARKNKRRLKKDILHGTIKKMEKLVPCDDEYKNADEDLGFSYIEVKKYDRAIEHFLNAIEIDPADIKAYHGLAIACARNGDYGDAIENFEYVIKHLECVEEYGDDGSVDQYKGAFHGIGRVYYLLGDYELAIEYLDRYTEFNNESKQSYHLKTIMYFELEMMGEALRNLQLFNKYDKDHDAMYLVKGIQHLLDEKYEAAFEGFDKSRNYPLFKEFVYCFRAICQWKLMNLNKGLRTINEAIKAYPNCILARMIRGEFYEDLFLEQEAINDYEMVIAHCEKNQKIYGDTIGTASARIGMIHFEHGDYEKAFSLFNKTSHQDLTFLIDLARSGNKPA